MTLFKPNYWGRLTQFEIPHSIVQDGRLVLKPNALTTLLILFQVGKAQQRRNTEPFVDVKITQTTLMQRTGFSKNLITAAVQELDRKKFIRCSTSRRKYGEFGANVYTLCNPASGDALTSQHGRNFLLSNKLQYIKMPSCVVREHEAEWSIAKMSSSEVRMYVALCWLANRKNKNELEVERGELKKLAAFSTLPTTEKALDGLADKGLVFTMTDRIILQDPYTGEALHVEDGDPDNDPANYYDTAGNGRATRLNLNSRKAEDVEKLLQDCGAEAILQRDGEYKIHCPFHSDLNPSCSVSPTKRCFYCFGCQATGPLTKLVMKLRAVDKGEAIQFMARSAGKLVEYHEPDNNFEAVYQYFDSEGRLKKEVLRYPGKKFAQRRPAPSGGWIWNTAGMQPMLYNMNRLKFASVVCLCEGEKDCHTLAGLGLYGIGGDNVVPTTSGNSDSWNDTLADGLVGKRVIVMPDDDEPGERFRAEVVASLKSRKIEYRIVSFRDAGAKDVSDFIAKGGRKEDLVQRIGEDWVSLYAQPHLKEFADESIPF